GYDSKYVNVLYVDKLMKYIDVIQSFSRTNRLFGPEKPFGIIKYFHRPNTMKKNIDDALELYVDQPMSVFTDKLEANLEKINEAYKAIRILFEAEGIKDFASLPQSEISRKKFAKEFCEMNRLLGASKMQGFDWEKKTYEFKHTNGYTEITVELDEETYKILLQRYKELFVKKPGDPVDPDMYQLESYITETAAGTIDADYINSRFVRFVKYLYTEGKDSEKVKEMQQQLHHVFATLSQRDQRTALTILHDIQRGDLRLSPDKTIYDYIKDYQKKEADYQVYALCEITGLDAKQLTDIINADVNEGNIDERNRFSNLTRTFNDALLHDFLLRVLGRDVDKVFKQRASASTLLRRFILNPSERAKILHAYNSDDIILDQENTDAKIEEEEKKKEEKEVEKEKKQEEGNALSDEEKRDNVAKLVMSNLRGISGWPGTDKTVNTFFKLINIPTADAHNGLAFDFYKVFDELFARKKPTFVDKHVGLGTLLIRFEVYLKKLYYLLHGREIPQQAGTERKVSLADAIHAFDCLWNLRNTRGEKYSKLDSYLTNLRNWRNTDEGNGGHSSIYMSEEDMDKRIKQVVTLYMYVTGCCLKDLQYVHPELA
ncbi:MAG: type I restriction endonuclease subunit R, partial [Muribaculaceae bacterium]|nr:type I restriction endonuclease subunit R [Muribaculaceae bacterium]